MSGNRYELPQKLQNLTPYDPLTGHYRIRLDANESFLSPPPELMEELMAAVMAVDFNRYPDPYAVELCEKCAAFFGVDPSMVVAGNGSDELIGLIVSWFTEPGDTMAVVRPDFSMYSFYAQPCAACWRIPRLKKCCPPAPIKRSARSGSYRWRCVRAAPTTSPR